MNGAFVDKAGLQRKPSRFTQVNLVKSRPIDLTYLAVIRELVEFLLISLRGNPIVSGKRELERNLSKAEFDLP